MDSTSYACIIMITNKVFLLAMMLVAMEFHLEACPNVCVCDVYIVYDNETLILTDCSSQGLSQSPVGIPVNTQYLDISGNAFTEVRYETVVNLTELLVLDTRYNENLRDLPTATSLLNLTTLYTDKGSTCCIYELNWMKEKGWESDSYQLAKESCLATIPYAECKDDLINTVSLTIYTVTLVCSLIFNPWVILVNMAIRHRRHDPHILILVHFSLTNIFLTLYAAIFVCYGFMYLNSYQYHMDEWMENPACTFTGFMLVGSTLHFSFLCTIVVIHFYRQIHNPLVKNRQFTAKRVHLTVLVIGLMAISISLLPFVTGDNYYNNVALCLPFYSSKGDESKFNIIFLALYTTVMAILLIVIITLSGIIVHSLRGQSKKIENNEDHTNTTDQRILEENRRVRQAILIKVSGYAVVTAVLVALLLMSSSDKEDIAAIGREWFARLCVIQAVVWPILGSFKHKSFLEDTRRMFQKWNCYDWEKNKIALRGLTRRTSPLS